MNVLKATQLFILKGEFPVNFLGRRIPERHEKSCESFPEEVGRGAEMTSPKFLPGLQALGSQGTQAF